MVQELKNVVKRRRKVLILTPIFFVALSFGALYIIEPKYESSTSVLVEKEETLNPLMMYEVAVNVASENRLKSFNEIIYSRSMMEMLIDSLNLDEGITSELEKQALVDHIQKNVVTNLHASDSFEITYFDTDPVRARDGVALLADHFIETRLRLENRRNSETVEFFQDKIDELEAIVDRQRNEMVSSTAEQMKEVPVDQNTLQSRLQNIDSQLDQLEWQIIQEENELENVRDFLNQDSQSFSVRSLYKLSFGQIPLGDQLGDLLTEYDQLRQQFTDDYPEVRSLRTQIIEVAKRIPEALQAALSNLKMQQKQLSSQRTALINDMERVFIASQRSSSQQSNHAIYQELYSDMKLKLEQARMTQDIGDKASDQFVVLDAPYVPKRPSFPNRRFVVVSGFLIGIVFGGIFAGMAEALDTRVRTEEDLELPKPIIAYLSDGRA